MIDLDNRVNFDIDLKSLETIIEKYSKRDIELIILDNDSIREINMEYRGKDSATDVLSFPLEDFPNAPLGSIIISIDKVKEKSLELGHSNSEEFLLLFIHGLLHLLGFDHEVDEGQMRSEEEKLIKELNLPDSLIVRNN